MIPAVVYAAKSTKDVHLSIPEQLDDCREMCRENGWEVIQEFTDENFTAFTGNRGPGLAAAIELAKRTAAERGVQVYLVAQHTSRFARGDGARPDAPKALVELWHEWARAGVRGRTVENDSAMSSSANAAAQGEADHNESKRKSKSVGKGLRRRARDRGLHNGGPRPYGYQWADGGLAIYEPEAAIMLRVYAEFLAGRGQRQIARDLNDDGVTAQRGGTWHQGTIARYLANPLYKGAVRLKGEVYEGQHEAIVDLETWEKARQLREGLSRTNADGGSRGRYPTGQFVFRRGHLRCGRCGEAMVPTTRQRGYEAYHCYRRMRNGVDACPQRPVRRELIDGAVWDFFAKVAVDVDATKAAILGQASAKVRELDALRDQAQRDAAKADADLARMRGYFREGRISPEEWHQERADLTAELEAASAQAARLEAQRDALMADVERIDVEDAALRELAAIRALVVGGAQEGRRDGLDSFRAALRRMFERFELVPSGSFDPLLAITGSSEGIPWQGRKAPAVSGAGGFLLIPYVRPEAVNWTPEDTEFPALRRVALALGDFGANALRS